MQLQGLSGLELTNISITPPATAQQLSDVLSAVLQRSPHMAELTLGQGVELGAEGIPALSSMKHLQHVSLLSTALQPSVLDSLPEDLPSVHVGEQRTSGQQLVALCDALASTLQRLTGLTALKLDSMRVQPMLFDAAPAAKARLSSLTLHHVE